jgi:Holliday junction resolvase-like predicted endonuclease
LRQGVDLERSVENILIGQQGFSTKRNLRVCGREIDLYAIKKDVVDIIIAIECKTNKVGIGVAEQYVQKYRRLKNECKEFNAKDVWIVSSVGFTDSAMNEIINKGMFAYTYSELISKYGASDISCSTYEDFKFELTNSSSELEKCKIAVSGILT